MRTRTAGLATALLATALFAGACGGGDSTTDTAEATSTTTASDAADTEPADAKPAEAPPADAKTVEIKDFAFNEAKITIKAGTTVVWTNRDAFLHTVTSGKTDGPENIPDGLFDHPLDDAGATAQQAFNKPGTFTYYCKQHNAMDGTITVTA